MMRETQHVSHRPTGHVGSVATSVAAGLAGALVVVLLLGTSFTLLIPAGLGVGLVALVASWRSEGREDHRSG